MLHRAPQDSENTAVQLGSLGQTLAPLASHRELERHIRDLCGDQQGIANLAGGAASCSTLLHDETPSQTDATSPSVTHVSQALACMMA